jgi:carboxymethylenebutenolidase
VNDFQTYLVHEFVDDYKDGYLSRRDLIRLVLPIAGGIASTAAILTTFGCGSDDDDSTSTMSGATASATGGATPASSPGSTDAGASLSVPADDPGIVAEDITFDGNDATLMAYQAQPSAANGPRPLVLICHENRGLTEHIRDVARRFAKEGYLACALDLLSREGGTASVANSDIPGALSGADPARHVGDFQAAVKHYKALPDLADTSRIAMIGYCFGGGITWRAITQIPDIKAAAPYYGPPPPLDQVPNIQAAVLGVYSSDPGDFANNGRDDLKAALEQAGITHQFNIYPDTQHAFHNDTGPRYNLEQARAAWQDTLAWFERTNP